MTDHVYKTIELTGTSTDGVEAAVHNAVTRASETLHNLRWFEVTAVRGEIADGFNGRGLAFLMTVEPAI